MATPELPTAIKEIFDPLCNAVTRLHANHSIFKDLYGTQEAVDVLNETAPGAFYFIGLMFRDNFIIAASRLTDPKTTGKGKKAKENLTLKQLIHAFNAHCPDKKLVEDLVAREKKIADHCEDIRERRNRVVAHLDLKTALDQHPEALPVVEMKQIDELLRMLAEFMNVIIGYYHGAYRDFSPIITGPANSIIQCLKGFHRLRKKELEWLKKGL